MGFSNTVLDLAGAGFGYHDAGRPHTDAPAAADDPAANPTTAALTGINLRIQRGQMVAVLGPQESGTSTLCRLAAGLLADRGHVTGTVHRPRTVAMLGDDPEAQLTSMATFVRDEVRLPGRLRTVRGGDTETADTQAARAMEALHITHLADRRLETLSGGERQSVALASLLTLMPDLLVLDQPSLSLDGPARARLVRALKDYCGAGGAVLVTGHQHDELSAAADTRYFLAAGRLTDKDAGVWNTLGSFPTGPQPSGPQVAGLQVAGLQSPGLQVAHLGVVRGQATVLQDVTFHAPAGHVTTLLGTNGAGKSTLLLALAGLLERKAQVTGTITMDTATMNTAGRQHRLDEMAPHARASLLAWVGQDPGAQLSAPSVRLELERAIPLPRPRRLRLAARSRRNQQIAQLLQDLQLENLSDVHPFDLPPDRRKDLVIAAAMLLRPAVLLLDEPTLGRDSAGMARLDAVIAAHTASGGSVVATTHDTLWGHRVSDQIVELREGAIIPTR